MRQPGPFHGFIPLIIFFADTLMCSAGGGGKSERRKAKLEAKNRRLEAQRQRAAKKLQEQKKQKKREKNQTAEVRGAESSSHRKGDSAGVHPSRRSRVPDA